MIGLDLIRFIQYSPISYSEENKCAQAEGFSVA